MANCEYRNHILVQEEKVFDTGLMTVAVLKKDEIPFTCKVKIRVGSDLPLCDLIGESTQTCPIARFYKGELTINECNQRLTEIFESEKA